MSVTFRPEGPATYTQAEEPCLCAQMAPLWCAFFRGEDTGPEARASLAAYALPDCHACHGAGIETAHRYQGPEINWANDNARTMFAVLGLAWEPMGAMPLPVARRAVMRARNRGTLAPFARAEQTEHGAPRACADGTVELRPVRCSAAGLSEASIIARVDALAAFVDACAALGAASIAWD